MVFTYIHLAPKDPSSTVAILDNPVNSDLLDDVVICIDLWGTMNLLLRRLCWNMSMIPNSGSKLVLNSMTLTVECSWSCHWPAKIHGLQRQSQASSGSGTTPQVTSSATNVIVRPRDLALSHLLPGRDQQHIDHTIRLIAKQSGRQFEDFVIWLGSGCPNLRHSRICVDRRNFLIIKSTLGSYHCTEDRIDKNDAGE